VEGKSNYRGPERVVLLNASGFFENEQARKLWEDKFRRVMDDGFEQLRPHLFAREPIWFRWVASEFAHFATKEDIVEFMKSVREDHYLETLVPKIRAHVWLVWGEEDTLNPPACAPRWLESLSEAPGASVVLLRGTGHSPQVEKPAVITAVLAQILRKDSVSQRLGERWWRLLQATEAQPARAQPARSG
jgi:pimeloyl-ACP methyl ester carboxylesterase